MAPAVVLNFFHTLTMKSSFFLSQSFAYGHRGNVFCNNTNIIIYILQLSLLIFVLRESHCVF